MTAVRPIILAAGLGTRLRPRTSALPKPLLPVGRTPLIAHVLDSIEAVGLQKPLVVVGYLGESIAAFLQEEDVEIVRAEEDWTMAESVLSAVDRDEHADAFWCLSSDVLIPLALCRTTIKEFESGRDSVLVLSRLAEPGHKKWMYRSEGGHLTDVSVATQPVAMERGGLVLTREALNTFTRFVGRPVMGFNVKHELHGFQSGWILMLKVMSVLGVPVRVIESSAQVMNVNVPDDFEKARAWLSKHR